MTRIIFVIILICVFSCRAIPSDSSTRQEEIRITVKNRETGKRLDVFVAPSGITAIFSAGDARQIETFALPEPKFVRLVAEASVAFKHPAQPQKGGQILYYAAANRTDAQFLYLSEQGAFLDNNDAARFLKYLALLESAGGIPDNHLQRILVSLIKRDL